MGRMFVIVYALIGIPLVIYCLEMVGSELCSIIWSGHKHIMRWWDAKTGRKSVEITLVSYVCIYVNFPFPKCHPKNKTSGFCSENTVYIHFVSVPQSVCRAFGIGAIMKLD